MRKRVARSLADDVISGQDCLDVERLSHVDVTSEDSSHPIEAALLPQETGGWRAAEPGEQTIRLIFDQPQRLTRTQLAFVEREMARTQEFVLRWSPDNGRSFRDIVRQQWNFSPPETDREAEDYRVDLSGVTMLELSIIPDKNGGAARASIERWRLFG